LNKINGHTQHGDDKDDGRVDGLAHDNRNAAGDQQNEDKWIEEEQQQFKRQCSVLAGCRIVWTELTKPLFCFSLAEPLVVLLRPNRHIDNCSGGAVHIGDLELALRALGDGRNRTVLIEFIPHARRDFQP
jgi:hypothetical protein